MYNVINSIDDCNQLQNNLLLLESGQMQFNSSKCSTNKKLTLSFTYHINNVPIKAVQHAKYLGMTIDSMLMLTWKEHIKITTHKTNTALVFLRCNLKPCSLYIKSKCYLGTVRPISLSMLLRSVGSPHCSRYIAIYIIPQN